jgi:hypothetical protein
MEVPPLLTLPIILLRQRFLYDPATGFMSREAARHAYLAAKAQLHLFVIVGG